MSKINDDDNDDDDNIPNSQLNRLQQIQNSLAHGMLSQTHTSSLKPVTTLVFSNISTG